MLDVAVSVGYLVAAEEYPQAAAVLRMGLAQLLQKGYAADEAKPLLIWSSLPIWSAIPPNELITLLAMHVIAGRKYGADISDVAGDLLTVAESASAVDYEVTLFALFLASNALGPVDVSKAYRLLTRAFALLSSARPQITAALSKDITFGFAVTLCG